MVRLDGAVETAVRLGVADVIADVVETGTTLRQAGLEIVGEPILESEAVLVRRPGCRRLAGGRPARPADAGRDRRPAVRADRLRHPGRAASRRRCALTPGIESPTVSPLHDRGWVAVRAMVPRADTNQIMDEL